MKAKSNYPFVIVRTYSAGVFAGYLVKRTGKECELQKAIRLWYWKGAASLSQLAIEGVTRPTECKFGIPVDLTVTEAIEIIQTTRDAQQNIQGVASWRA
jgi:hypothetical protein